MTSPALFLFDLDGTLVTTGGAGLRALARAFEDLFGVRDIVPKINPAGKTDPAIFRELVRGALERDLRESETERISESYLSHLEREISRATVTVLPGVRDFLAHLSGRPAVWIGLGTGNLETGARLKLAPTGLNSFFSFGGFGSDAEERSRLLTVGHRRAEERAGGAIPRERVFVIGDTALDVAAARRAGFRAIAVASGNVALADLRASQPDAAIPSMSDAFDLLEELIPGLETRT